MDKHSCTSYLPINSTTGHESDVLCSHNEAEILFCEKGELQILLGGEIHILVPGTFFLLPPGIPHTVTGNGVRNCTVYRFDPLSLKSQKESRLSRTISDNPFTGLLQYIDSHSGEELTLDLAAHRAGFSRHHFSRQFHRYMGCTFTEYLTLRRIEQSKDLLSTDLSVTDIAFQTGFNSLSAFSRCFKKHTGLSPSEYRLLPATSNPLRFPMPPLQ